MGGLRDYQARLVDASREKLYTEKKKSAVLQLPTGAGKTAVLSEIFAALYRNKKRGWFIVPRRELVRQASAHLAKWGVRHGIIDASHEESRAYLLHVVSKDTAVRRLGKIKNAPDLAVFDEAHVALDGQAKVMRAMEGLNPRVKFLGLTATPEREDGRGLSELYEDIIYGASIPYLTEAGFLAPLRYFAPPVEGIERVRFRGGEADEAELDAVMTERAVYGKAAEYYRNHGRKADGSYMRALGFCHGVKAAEKQAAEFRAAGHAAEAVSGYMPKARQRALIDGFNGGRVQVLVNADLLTYGFDSPGIEYGFSLRRTASRALYFQIVGRILRTTPGKGEALFFDHANAISLHQDPRYPGTPLFYIPDLEWNFAGKEKRKAAAKGKPPLRMCPYNAFEICLKPCPCARCERYAPGENGEPIIESVPLAERQGPGEQYVITAAERRELQDDVIRYCEIARLAADDNSLDRAVKKLAGIAKRLGYAPMWVYRRANAQK
ncbi:MAG: DEAD/DEAH box helicase, partial [Treponema sp.]|nr:DEAD/DEAH box helicase [Treponema sp.]